VFQTPCVTCPVFLHGYGWLNYSLATATMSSSAAADGSEDVNDFLQRIKELGDKRDQEDEERNRKLEEEILQGRKERQARRAGR
jgi:uncharacterized protein YgfB (UPF0149 family)